jgi:hypothetical protein
MEKRYQVFVSSTFRDLEKERQAVMQALLELDCIPAGMELFPASDETAWQLIERVIEGCDYYIVILGGRYGATDADGVSYTEREFDTAVRLGIPVLPFVHEDPAKIPAGDTELDPVARERLAAFRKKVEVRHRKTYKSPEDLAGKVSRAINVAIKLQPREGWVPGRYASSPERINELRARIDELERQLEDARVKPPVEAEGLARGDDPFEVAYRLRQDWRTQPFTWDELIELLGPLMFHEASEDALLAMVRSTICAAEGAQRYEVAIDGGDFQTIKVQLLALGLIQQSDRKHAASNTHTYWTLTPFGRHYTMTLKAIRKESNAGN